MQYGFGSFIASNFDADKYTGYHFKPW
jgi:hypothetical protein